ncbi:MAG: KpsF/GutQ family sugar-phosphate isomerase [Bacteroidetes bacterium]|nr:KpsF/GutQ family sugar-phosphate isomerase [Bacteroidota bacterium]
MSRSIDSENIKSGRKVVAVEKNSIEDLLKRFSEKKFSALFSETVELIFRCKGKVVVTGIGKSGIIANKIAATFNSTGTYALFLHSADSIHGDMGVFRKGDIALIISKSGDTTEIRQLIPALKLMNIKIISISGNQESELARVSDIVLDSSVKKEACPHNLAPTSSTTAALVLGDAIAIALLEKREFTSDNFAMVHPGGHLGKRLLLKVDDIMTKDDEIPVVASNAKLKDVIYMISSKRLGCTCVTSKSRIAGIITDGDIRRLLEKNLDGLNEIKAKDIMNPNPKIISKEMPAITALEIMEKNKITQLIVGDRSKKPVGMIHMHRLIEEGL